MATSDSSPDDLFDLTGKVAVVTGGSRGLGKAMVEAFAQKGADVVITSRKLPACEILAEAVTEKTGRRALGVACHVGYWDQCNELYERVYDEFGRCDILVNNAGMSPLYDSLADVSEALFDKVIDVNLKGPFRLSAAFGSRMAAEDGGSIINVSSVAAVRPTPNEAAYGAAKSGLNSLTTSFAREYAPKVRVNSIMPGPFMTDISKAWDLEDFARRAKDDIPLQRGGQPDEVVGAALYFASDASTYTTGAVLKIDGGTAFAPA
jgi:NAD(P)-dependent dehydrogenase (short-subunit alcohol dehydrogenase family)